MKFQDEARLLDDLSEWEEKVRLYEDQSKETLTQSMKKAVSMQGLPSEVKPQMQLKPNVDSYNDFRAQLRDHVHGG